MSVLDGVRLRKKRTAQQLRARPQSAVFWLCGGDRLPTRFEMPRRRDVRDRPFGLPRLPRGYAQSIASRATVGRSGRWAPA